MWRTVILSDVPVSYRPDFHIQGDSFFRRWRVREADGEIIPLTNATVRLQIRNNNDVLLAEATTDNGRITLDAAAGEITVNIPHPDMSAVTTAESPCYYDLELTLLPDRRTTIDRALLTVLRQHTL